MPELDTAFQKGVRQISVWKDSTRIQYNEMMYAMSIITIVPKTAILAVYEPVSTAYRFLQKALELGHIREYKYTVKCGGKKHEEEYYQITEVGIRYLQAVVEDLAPHQQWISNVPVSDKTKTRISYIRKSRLRRFLSISECGFIMSSVGCQMNPLCPEIPGETKAEIISKAQSRSEEVLPLDASKMKNKQKSQKEESFEEDEEFISTDDDDITKLGTQNDLESLIIRAKRDYDTKLNADVKQFQNGLEMEPQPIIFRNVYEVKKDLSSSTELCGNFRGRYVGIAESPLKTVIVYSGESSKTSWSNQLIKIEARAYATYARKSSVYHSLEIKETHGVMFVDNAKEFTEAITFSPKGCFKNILETSTFYSFCIFPTTFRGALLFRDYMQTDTEEFDAIVATQAIQSGYYKENTDYGKSIFPIVNKNGTKVVIGVFMDVVKVNRASVIAKRRNEVLGILCYKWQIDFYKRVYKNAEYMTIG